MPRPASMSNKIVDGRMSPASPRWGGVHGSGNSQGSSGTTSKRGTTPVSSPRAYAQPSGTTRGSAGRDNHSLRSITTDSSERRISGSSTKGRKSMDVDNTGGRDDAGEDSGRIRVAVRVRPFSEKEKQAGKRCVISMAGSQTKILDPAYFDSEDGASSPDDRSMWERTFSFDHSFWSHCSDRMKDARATGDGGGNFSSQADVHQALGNFLLDNACRGFNCSLFAYGQTGSGKTYTMLGDSSDLTSAAGEGTAGLIPRICVELFQRFGLTSGGQGNAEGGAAKAFRGNGQASVKVSFCEIYNEQVRDLFGHVSGGHGLRVREHPTKGAFVEGLSARPVSCYQQVQQLLEDGMSARATAATAMNEVSSRSHAIFTVHITVTVTTKLSHGGRDDGERVMDADAEEDISSRTSKICLVDLAGSERANATGAKGDRLREAANINKSLSTLGDVIKALAKRADSGRGSGGGGMGGSSSSENFIPYRNSMLTWLLKDSIGGNSKTVMLAAISPVADAYQETMSTLRYVERAKEIVNSVAINDANANPLVGKLREEVRAMQELLEAREATIAEHEGNVAMLTAALERARTGDDDKVLRALADADELEAALLAERRDRDRIEAAALKEAEAQERKHARELQEEAERHAADFEKCLERHEEEISRAREEAAQMLAFEVDLAKDQAAEERARMKVELEQNYEFQRVTVAEAHTKEMAAAAQRHRAEADRALEEAAGATARAAESAVAEMAELRERHAVEMAESAAAAEAARLEEFRHLRKEVEREKEAVLQELSEARRLEEAERNVELQEKVAAEIASAAESRVAAIKELREQHDASFVRLSEAHAIDIKAAVEEAVNRLNIERENAMVAAERAKEKATKEVRHAEAKRLEKENVAKLEGAISSLRASHEKQLETLSSAHGMVLQEVRHDADEKLEALRAECGRSVQAAEHSHREYLASARNERDVEVRRVIEAEKIKTEAAVAAAIEAQRAETDAARTAEETKNRGDIRTLGKRLEAEIKVVIADSEQRKNEAIAGLQAEHDEAEASRQAQLVRLSDEHAAAIATLQAEHEEHLRNEMSFAAASADSRRKADVEAAELRAAERIAANEAEAAVNLAVEQEHRDEISRREKQARVEIVELQARAASAQDVFESSRELHQGELVKLRRSNDDALDKARDDGDARLAAAQAESGRKVKAVQESHQEELASMRMEYEKELRGAIEVGKVESEVEHAAAIKALKAELEAGRICQEQKSREEMEEAKECLSRSIAEVQREHEIAIEASDARNKVALAVSDATHRDEIELAMRTAKGELASARTEAAVALASQAARHQEQMAGAQKTYNEEISRSEAELDALHRALAQEEDRVKEVSEAVERKLAEDREKLAVLEASYQTELERLRDGHAAAAAEAERRRTSELAEATRRYESSANVVREEMAEERAKFVSTHLLEMRQVKESGRTELQRVLREAEERSTAQEAKAASEMNDAKLAHLRDLQAAAASAEEAREVELAAVNDALESTTSELKAEIGRLEEQHQEQLRKIFAERDAEDSTRSTAASDLHAKALAELSESHEICLEEALQAERSSHAAFLSAAQTKESAAVEAAILATEQGKEREERLRETLESEHRLAVDVLEEAHCNAMEELRDARRKETEELERKAEAAQAAAEDAQASAEELATRANALDEMLKASVGSNELELAGHRSRVAQLQGFVARREAASSSSSPTSAAEEEKNSHIGGLSPAATRSLQQRFMDLRAMAAAVGSSVGAKPGSVETGMAEFASTGMIEGLTVEKYAEELEVILVRATVEAAAARQDHLEADMQCQSITRQLVGLKLVHAQLRECLEDTQIKLEHKSQSAARRLLNSAARLAYEFAKPDRTSSRASGSPKSTKPKAMSRQNSGARSPLSRTRGGALRRNKTPERRQERQGLATEQVPVDFSATL